MPPSDSGRAASRQQIVALRRRFLMIGLAVTFVWGGPILAAYSAGWVPFSPVQADNTVAIIGLNAVLFFVLWRWPGSFRPVAWIFCSAVFVYTTVAQFLVPQDHLRMLLFF